MCCIDRLKPQAKAADQGAYSDTVCTVRSGLLQVSTIFPFPAKVSTLTLPDSASQYLQFTRSQHCWL